MAKIVVLGSFANSLVTFRGAMLNDMVRRGHQVVACAPDASFEIQNILSKIKIEYQDMAIDRSGFNPVKDLYTVCRIFTFLRKVRPDIFFSYTVKPVIYGSLAAKLAGVPRIYSMITGLGYAFGGEALARTFLSTIVRMLYRMSLKTNHRIFFQNPDDLNFFTQLGILSSQEKAVLINGTGVDVDYYRPVPFPEKISFLMIARLLRDKGIREYAKAAHIIKRNYPQIAFRLAGWLDDNPASISEDEINSWSKEGTIEYLGELSDVCPAIAASSVYVLPSYREGIPRTVLEAMAMGRPIITTNAPGCRETVQEGKNGFLVPVKDVQVLANVMKKFIEESGLIPRMGRESRKIAVNKFDVRSVNKVILESMGLG